MTVNKYTFILILLIPPILIAGIALLFTYVPLPAPLPQAGSHDRNLPAAILTGILGMAWVIALTFFVVNSYLSAGRVLESVFTSMGLSASNYLVLGRQYQGRVDGRSVEAQFLPGRMLQKSLLNIRIGTNIDYRMAIGANKPLLDCHECEKVDIASINLGDIQIYADDPIQAQIFMTESSNSTLISSLMDNPERLGMREIYLQPGWIWLHARPSPRLDAHHVQIWLELLLDLSRAIAPSN